MIKNKKFKVIISKNALLIDFIKKDFSEKFCCNMYKRNQNLIKRGEMCYK